MADTFFAGLLAPLLTPGLAALRGAYPEITLDVRVSKDMHDLAGRSDGLEQRGSPIDALDSDLWRLVHPDLGRAALVRAVLDALTSSRAITRALGASPKRETETDAPDRNPCVEPGPLR